MYLKLFQKIKKGVKVKLMAYLKTTWG